MKSLGILLTNTGTPDTPSVADVQRYLKSFLSDRRIVRLPRLVWLPLLHSIVLRRRAPYSAKLYQKIWTQEGSPLLIHTRQLATHLEKYLRDTFEHPVYIEVGMHYGNPSVQEGIEKLLAHHIERLLILPLFPQYSTTTTETAYDQVRLALQSLRGELATKQSSQLDPIFIPPYAAHSNYIAALCQQIKNHYNNDHYLLFSFHGLPQRFAEQGDSYAEQCYKTAALVTEALQFQTNNWSVSFQSRFGYAKWLTPYTFEALQKLPLQGFTQVSVVCPGFAVDCLETLEEIQIRGKEEFLNHGGKEFHYIPALNASSFHVEALGEILRDCRA